MIGYPKNITGLTKRDFENLLSMPEYKERAVADLKRLAAIDDAIVLKDISAGGSTLLEEKELELIEIENTMPAWMKAGFASKDELSKLVLRK